MSSSSVSSETTLVSLGCFGPLRLTFQAAQKFRTQSDEPSVFSPLGRYVSLRVTPFLLYGVS